MPLLPDPMAVAVEESLAISALDDFAKIVASSQHGVGAPAKSTSA